MSRTALSMFLILVAILTISNESQAQTETYYDILKRISKTTGEPIAKTDIDVFGSRNARRCYEFTKETPFTSTPVIINLFTRITEARGALFPKVTETKVIYKSYFGDVFRERIFDQTLNEYSPKEIKISQLDNQGIAMWKINLKKKGNILFYKKEMKTNSEMPPQIFYGTCDRSEDLDSFKVLASEPDAPVDYDEQDVGP